jgi:transposase
MGGYSTVRDYVRRTKTRRREVFVPLAHPPGHAQIDFGEAIGVIGGQRLKMHVFCCHLPHSDAFYLKAYRAETQEALLDGIASAFGFFGGVPQSVLLDSAADKHFVQWTECPPSEAGGEADIAGRSTRTDAGLHAGGEPLCL